jgi:ATP-dependent RNA helicase RhlE
VPHHLKTGLLLEILTHTGEGSVLVFTRTKHRAKRVAQQLEKAGYKAASLQGNLSQNRRQEALDGFRDGSYQVLVATDIAARGIDVSSVSHVINYDIPDTVDAYTHRIGRTGRAAKTGDAFTFITHEDEPMIRSIERVLGGKIGRRTVMGFDYTKPAPARDTEFARPPREPQRRRVPGRPEQGRGQVSPRSHASTAPSGRRTHAGSPQRPQSGPSRPATAPGGSASRRSWGPRPSRGPVRGPSGSSR